MSIGFWQIALIFIVVLIIFGAGKLPKVMSDLGKGLRSFKEGMNENEEDETPPTAKPAVKKKNETVKLPSSKPKSTQKKTASTKKTAKKTPKKKSR